GPSQRPHQEAGGEHAEGGDRRRDRIRRWEEVSANGGREIAVDGEIVPLHDVAHGAGGNQAPRQVGGVDVFIGLSMDKRITHWTTPGTSVVGWLRCGRLPQLS